MVKSMITGYVAGLRNDTVAVRSSTCVIVSLH